MSMQDEGEDAQNASLSTSLIVALAANNSWEVGFASIFPDRPLRLEVSQIPDNRVYATTIRRLELGNPREILIPDSHANHELIVLVSQRFPNRCTHISRSKFNATMGTELITELASNAFQGVDLNTRYLGRAAAAALVTYCEQSRAEGGERFAKGSIFVSIDAWHDMADRVSLEASTVRSLELVANRRTGGREGTLLEVLGSTTTAMGARFLRTQILAPPSVLSIIQSRLDAVQESMEKSDLLAQIKEILKTFPDADKITSRFTTTPQKYTTHVLRSEIAAVVGIREVYRSSKRLAAALSEFQTEVWRELATTLDNETAGELESLAALVDSKVTNAPDTSTLVEASDKINLAQQEEVEGELEAFDSETRGRQHRVLERRGARRGRRTVIAAKRTDHLQDIFCIRADEDGLLDAARIAYTTLIGDMERLVDEIIEAHTWLSRVDGSISLRTNASRGYHLRIKRSEAEEHGLPPAIIQAVRTGPNILCTTRELAILNDRHNRLQEEILRLTAMQLAPVRESVRSSIPALCALSDAVAIADVLVCFALVCARQNYARPRVVAGGAYKLKNLRHPVLELILANYVPNDIELGHGQRLAILTGPNAVGKSSLLSAIACATILIHIGCMIPIDPDSEIPLIGRICTRIDTNDSIEQNASTFSLEMHECAIMLEAVRSMQRDCDANRACLCLIDELGRGTSTKDGLAIAWAASEELAANSACRAFFATHFSQLRSAAAQRPHRVASLRFLPTVVPGDVHETQTYRLQIDTHNSISSSNETEDAEQEGGYGVALARNRGMPEALVRRATESRHRLATHFRLVQRSFNNAASKENQDTTSSHSEAQDLHREIDKVLSAIATSTSRYDYATRSWRVNTDEARELLQRLQAQLQT